MSIELDPKVIEFIEQNIQLIETKKWNKVYNQDPIPIGFTDAMLNAGINPLNQGLDYVPEYFLFRSKINFFVVPNNVEVIKFGAFESCKNLTDIIILDNVKIIEECAFQFCRSLTNIKLPESLTSIQDQAFSHCENLTSIEIPANIVSVGKSAFLACTQLTKIKINQTIQQAEETLQLHIKKDWQRGSNIKKIICIDGEIDLT